MSVIANSSIVGATGATGAVGPVGATGPIGPSNITGDPTVLVSGNSSAGYNITAVQQLTTTSNPIFNQVTVSAPQTDSQVATKQYVDTVTRDVEVDIFENTLGDGVNILPTVNGSVTAVNIALNPNISITQGLVSGAVTKPTNIATKGYVDNAVSAVVQYITPGANIVNTSTATAPTLGVVSIPTFTQATISTTPVNSTDTATKGYVDNAISGLGFTVSTANINILAGGTLPKSISGSVAGTLRILSRSVCPGVIQIVVNINCTNITLTNSGKFFGISLPVVIDTTRLGVTNNSSIYGYTPAVGNVNHVPAATIVWVGIWNPNDGVNQTNQLLFGNGWETGVNAFVDNASAPATLDLTANIFYPI